MRRSLERHRNILDFTLSSLARRKGKNVSLLALYTLMVFMLASVLFFTRSLREEARLLLAGSPEMIVQRTVAGRHDLVPAGFRDVVAGVRGVAGVHPRLWGYYYDRGVGANYTIQVPLADPPEPGSARLGAGVARARRLSVGDPLALLDSRGEYALLEVEELLEPESELLSADLILVSAEDFRGLFGIGADQATDLAVSVPNPRELNTVARKIVELLPEARPITRSEILRTYDSIFDWRGGMVTVVLASAVLSFLVFAWDKATGLSAEERREIGILKAIGWETSDVLLMRFWEGAVVSATAFLVGVLLAYAHVFLAPAPLFEHALKGWAVLYPRFRLVPRLDGLQLAVLLFFTVVPYTAATIVPSWRAATRDPDEALRS